MALIWTYLTASQRQRERRDGERERGERERGGGEREGVEREKGGGERGGRERERGVSETERERAAACFCDHGFSCGDC